MYVVGVHSRYSIHRIFWAASPSGLLCSLYLYKQCQNFMGDLCLTCSLWLSCTQASTFVSLHHFQTWQFSSLLFKAWVFSVVQVGFKKLLFFFCLFCAHCGLNPTLKVQISTKRIIYIHRRILSLQGFSPMKAFELTKILKEQVSISLCSIPVYSFL